MSGRPDAVERLRSLLEERGVPYDAPTEFATAWKDPDGHPVDSICTAGRVFVSHVVTPERAVEVTLGRGTCEWILEHSGTLYDKWRCSKCGTCSLSRDATRVIRTWSRTTAPTAERR